MKAAKAMKNAELKLLQFRPMLDPIQNESAGLKKQCMLEVHSPHP